MNKKEFLETLRKKLSILDENEVNDIILEYSNHIDQKIKDGKKEKEAVAAFGDIDDLSKEILKGYKIADDYSSNDLLNNLAKFFKDLVNSAERQFSSFAKNNNLDITNTLVSILVALAMLFAVNIFITVLDHLGRTALGGEFLWGAHNPISVIWIIIINIVRVLVILAIIFSTYNSVVNHDKKIKKNTYKKEENSETKTKTNKVNDDIKEPFVYEKTESKDTMGAVRIVLSVFAALFSIPFIFTIIGLSIAISIFIGLMFKGVVFIGIPLILLGLCFILSSIVGFLFDLIGGK